MTRVNLGPCFFFAQGQRQCVSFNEVCQFSRFCFEGGVRLAGSIRRMDCVSDGAIVIFVVCFVDDSDVCEQTELTPTV